MWCRITFAGVNGRQVGCSPAATSCLSFLIVFNVNKYQPVNACSQTQNHYYTESEEPSGGLTHLKLGSALCCSLSGVSDALWPLSTQSVYLCTAHEFCLYCCRPSSHCFLCKSLHVSCCPLKEYDNKMTENENCSVAFVAISWYNANDLWCVEASL